MKELVQRLVDSADLNEEQAQKVAEVVKGFVAERLPDSVRDTAMGYITGENVDHAVDQVTDAVKSFLS